MLRIVKKCKKLGGPLGPNFKNEAQSVEVLQNLMRTRRSGFNQRALKLLVRVDQVEDGQRLTRDQQLRKV